jgi:hypothetical protein
MLNKDGISQVSEPEPNTLLIEEPALQLGFVQLPKQVLFAKNISRDAKLLYAVLLGYAWQEQRCFPGYRRLCDDMGASENMVRKYMRELEAADLLKQKRRGLGKTNIYTLKALRTSKIAVQEPQFSNALEPAKSEVKEETVEEETEMNTSNLRMPSPQRKSGNLESQNGISGEKKRSAGGWRGRKSTAVYDENREVILDYIKDFAPELGDEAKLASSVTRAQNIFRRSGVSMEAFIGKMYEARSIVKENSGKIRKETKPNGKAFSVKSRMAYWFATLENLLEKSTSTSSITESDPAEAAATASQRLL